MPKYILTRKATSDLAEIWDYTFARWGLEQAETYSSAIRADLSFLLEFPERRRPCDAIKRGLFKHPSGSHVIFYTVSDENVIVMRVLHQRMDFPRHLR